MQAVIQHQKQKRHRSMRWFRGFIQTRLYDLEYVVDVIGGLNYNVNLLGNITTIADSAGGNNYQYDNLDRITKVENSATLANVTAFTYDKTGNRLSKTVGALASATYSYPSTNHRLSSVAGVARTYDANGNTTKSAAAKFFTYDARNRLVDFRTGAAASTIVSQYQYNAKGERVTKSRSDSIQNYLFNDDGQLLVHAKQMSDGSSTTQEIIWLDDMPIGINTNGTLHGILADHLNTPRAVFEINTQKTVWRWNAVDDAFGENLASEDPDANAVMFKLDMRFAGQLYDSESGLHYNYFRDYEAGTGRYVQSDPIGLAGGISTFGYVLANPLRLIDPTGQEGVGYWTFAPGTRERAYYENRPAPTQKEICQKLASIESLLNITPFVGTGKALIDSFFGDTNVMQFASSSGSTAGAIIEYGARREDSALTRRQEVLTRRGGNRKEQQRIAAGLERSAGTQSLVKIFGRATFFIGLGLETYNINENLEKCACIK